MAVNKEKKSFKKFARKHLANVIQTRRKTAKSKKEKAERLERRKVRSAKNAANEEKEHLEQLERLKDTNPEFFSYLEEEDPTLLQFGQENINVIDDDVGSDAETEEDENDNEDANEKVAVTRLNSVKGNKKEEEIRLTSETLSHEEIEETGSPSIVAHAEHERIDQEEVNSLIAGRNIEKVIDIFICATRELGYKVKERDRLSTTRKFADPTVVKDFLLKTCQFVAANVSELVSGKGAFKSFKTRYMVKRVLLAMVSLFASAEEVLSNDSTDVTLLTGLLHSVLPFVPLLHYVKGATKGILKSALHLCAAVSENVHLAAYMVVRAVATRATGTRSMYQSAAFKGIFLTLVKTSHQFTPQNQTIVAFLINCVIDLYGTDIEAAYQHTFVYLRQLSIYLRAALQQQSQSNVRAVVNWQYINALRTWGAVVSTYSEPTQLGPLIYPLVQITITLMDLFSSPRMFPMHLLLIEILNHVSMRAECMYIPVAPYLLRILTSPCIIASLRQRGGIIFSNKSNERENKREHYLHKRHNVNFDDHAQSRERQSNSGYEGKNNCNNSNSSLDNDESVQLAFTIRVKKSQSRMPAYHISLWQQTIYLLIEHLSTHSNSIGFPETFWAVEGTLKKLLPEIKIPRVHNAVRNLLQRYKETTTEIIRRRSDVNFGPSDISAVIEFEQVLKSSTNSLQRYYQSLRNEKKQIMMSKQFNSSEQRKTLDTIIAAKSKHKRTRSVKK